MLPLVVKIATIAAVLMFPSVFTVYQHGMNLSWSGHSLTKFFPPHFNLLDSERQKANFLLRKGTDSVADREQQRSCFESVNTQTKSRPSLFEASAVPRAAESLGAIFGVAAPVCHKGDDTSDICQNPYFSGFEEARREDQGTSGTHHNRIMQNLTSFFQDTGRCRPDAIAKAAVCIIAVATIVKSLFAIYKINTGLASIKKKLAATESELSALKSDVEGRYDQKLKTVVDAFTPEEPGFERHSQLLEQIKHCDMYQLQNTKQYASSTFDGSADIPGSEVVRTSPVLNAADRVIGSSIRPKAQNLPFSTAVNFSEAAQNNRGGRMLRSAFNPGAAPFVPYEGSPRQTYPANRWAQDNARVTGQGAIAGSQSSTTPGGDGNFNLTKSQNPYVRGELEIILDRHNPICTRCGHTGHFPRICQNAPLHEKEQAALARLVKEARSTLQSNVRATSSNPFVHEDAPVKLDRHNPLCTTCGNLGHYRDHCRNSPLPPKERRQLSEKVYHLRQDLSRENRGPFNPKASSNAFVRGDIIYTPAQGVLCTRCGLLGHSVKSCSGGHDLSRAEQNCLRDMIKKAHEGAGQTEDTGSGWGVGSSGGGETWLEV